MSTPQAEIADLQKKIDQMSKRREELSAELNKKSQDIDRKKKSLGADLLGGKDTSSGLDTIAREQVKQDALQEAIAQADDQIRTLRTQKSDLERGILMTDFYNVASELQNLTLDGIDKLYEFKAMLDAINDKVGELERAGGRAGIGEIRYLDQINLLLTVAGNLHSSVGGPLHESANRSIFAFENSYQGFIAEARSKRNH